MHNLLAYAERVAALLNKRNETVAVSESSTGGLITASLLALPGASSYCMGGVVLYTRQAWDALSGFNEAVLQGFRSATEQNALIRARFVRDRFKAHWGLGETGAAGPIGNRYGDPAGHCCVAVAGGREAALTMRTDNGDRIRNMYAFAARALRHFEEVLTT
jgi:nicotinamide-nucleotide amidase